MKTKYKVLVGATLNREIFFESDSLEAAREKYKYHMDRSMRGHGREADEPVLLTEDGVTIESY